MSSELPSSTATREAQKRPDLAPHRPRAQPPVRARLDRRREPMCLGAAFALTAAYLVWRASGVDSYVWLVDELLYTRGALGHAAGSLGGQIYGEAASTFSPLYAWFLTPVYGLLGSEAAFTAAHVLNALVFAGVIFPVYLTAKRLGAQPAMAILAGLMSVWIPWAVSTLVLMSESLTYFAFAWAVWGMVRAFDAPSPGREGAAIALIGVVAFCRPQFVMLLPVYLLAVGLTEWKLGSGRDAIARHWVAIASGAVGLLAAIVFGSGVFGGYAHAASTSRLFPANLWPSMLSHAAYVMVGSGILTAVVWLGWALRTASRPAGRPQLGFAIVSLTIVGMLVYVAGAFSQNFAGGQLQERYVFYVVSLFALGLAAMSADPRPSSPKLSMLGAAAIVGLVITSTAFDATGEPGAFWVIQAAAASFDSRLGYQLGRSTSALFGESWPNAQTLFAIAIACGIAATVITVRSLRKVALPLAAAVVLVYTAYQMNSTMAREVPALNRTIPASLAPIDAPKTWVDDAVAVSGGDVGVVEGALGSADDAKRWLWIEFWNKSIDRLYNAPGRKAVSGLPAADLAFDRLNGIFSAPQRKTFLVVPGADRGFALQGDLIRRGPFGARLIRPDFPYRAAWALLNPAAGDEPRRIAVYRRTGGTSADRPAIVSVTIPPDTTNGLAPTGETRLRVRIAAGQQRAIVTVPARRAG